MANRMKNIDPDGTLKNLKSKIEEFQTEVARLLIKKDLLEGLEKLEVQAFIHWNVISVWKRRKLRKEIKEIDGQIRTLNSEIGSLGATFGSLVDLALAFTMSKEKKLKEKIDGSGLAKWLTI